MNRARVVFLWTALLSLVGCSNPSEVVWNTEDSSIQGTLTISLSSIALQTIEPATNMNMASFDISGSGPDGASFSADGITGTAFTAENLTLGPWTISVDAYNDAGTHIMSGSATPTIVSGENTISIDVYPLPGNGTFNSTVYWQSDALSLDDTTIAASLTDTQGTPVPLDYEISADTAVCTLDVPKGYYIREINISEDGRRVYHNTDVIRIISTIQTAETLDLSDVFSFYPPNTSVICHSNPTIDWFDYPESVGYELHIADNPGFTDEEIHTTTASEFHIEPELPLGTTYYWYYLPIFEGNILGISGGTKSFSNELQIGGYYHGGYIFYLDGAGGGMVAAPEDQSTGIRHYGNDSLNAGASDTAVGTGLLNTNKLDYYGGDYAGPLCADLVLNGFDDWFLPSRDELDLMYENLHMPGIVSFSPHYYWSSSELYIAAGGKMAAYFRNFAGSVSSALCYKTTTNHVRAARSF